jgi:hypothetical protein
MSITPSVPNLSSVTSKKFWGKADSIPAWVLLIGLGALAFTFWGAIVPFVLLALTDTFWAIIDVVAIAVLLAILSSKRTWMMLRIVSRKFMSMFIAVFPIQVLKDRVAQMKKRRAVMEEQITEVHGQIGVLKNVISKNQTQSQQGYSAASYAKKKAASAGDQIEALRMQAQETINARKAGRLERANISYQDLLTKLTGIYDMLVKASIHVDAFVADAEDEARQEEIRYNTLNTAYKAYKTALSLITGDATEDDAYSETITFLADEAGRKLGEMEDMQRLAQGFMDNMDVQNGAVAEEAMEKLASYEQKQLLPGSQPTVSLLTGNSAAGVPVARVPVPATINNSSYGDMFR